VYGHHVVVWIFTTAKLLIKNYEQSAVKTTVFNRITSEKYGWEKKYQSSFFLFSQMHKQQWPPL